MNRLFVCVDSSGCYAFSPKYKERFYSSLGDAKNSIKKSIRIQNKRRKKDEKLKFEDYSIIEYELVEKDTHKL